MNEVSCRALGVVLDALSERGIPHADLVEGLPVTFAEIGNSRRRISWDLFAQLLERLEHLLGGPEALERAGLEQNRTASYEFVRRAASLFVHPRDVYWLGTIWFGRTLFGIVEDEFVELPDGRIRETLRIPSGYRPSKPFFHMVAGALRAAPHLVGLPDARVEGEIGPRKATYLITPPPVRRNVRGLLRSPRSLGRARGLIEELSEQQRELSVRNQELTATLEALRESEEKHRVATELASDFWFAARLSPGVGGEIVWVSDSVVRILHREARDFDASRWRAYIHRDDTDLVVRHVANAIRDGFDRAEFRVLSQTGKSIWLLQSTRATRDERSGVIELHAAATDVSERKKAESARALLATAVEQAGEGIAILDAKGVVRYVNPAFSRMLRTEHGELKGVRMEALAFGLGDRQLLAEMTQTLRRGDSWRGRYRSDWDDGSQFVRDATVTPMRDRRGRVESYVGVVRDVTHEVALEAELAQAHRVEALGRLSGGLAHDFNNLLTVISGCSEMLLRRGLDDAAQETAAQIRDASDRGSQLVRRLLAFSREQQLNPQRLDINTVIRELAKLLGGTLGDDVRIETFLAPDLDATYADRDQIEQSLLNLALNARDAMPDGGVLRLSTRAAVLSGDEAAIRGLDPGPYTVVEVADTGLGMDERTLARAFEPFFTTKEVGKGSGMGLAIVAGVAEQSGGDVSVVSSPGAGAVFTLFLPQADSMPGACGDPGPSDSPAALLVEVDDRVRRLSRSALQRAGLSVAEAGSPAEALEWAEKHDRRLDVLIANIVAAGEGIGLYDRLHRSHPETQVLYVCSVVDLAQSGWRPPAGTRLLFKPFTPTELVGEVRGLMGSARAGRRPVGTASVD